MWYRPKYKSLGGPACRMNASNPCLVIARSVTISSKFSSSIADVKTGKSSGRHFEGSILYCSIVRPYHGEVFWTKETRSLKRARFRTSLASGESLRVSRRLLMACASFQRIIVSLFDDTWSCADVPLADVANQRVEDVVLGISGSDPRGAKVTEAFADATSSSAFPSEMSARTLQMRQSAGTDVETAFTKPKTGV